METREIGMAEAMERAHLAQAVEHLGDAERRIAQQRELIMALDRDGHDATQARELLRTMVDTLALMRSHRDQIEDELTRVGG